MFCEKKHCVNRAMAKNYAQKNGKMLKYRFGVRKHFKKLCISWMLHDSPEIRKST